MTTSKAVGERNLALVIQNEEAQSHGFPHYFLELNGVQVLDGSDHIALQRITDAANTWATSIAADAVQEELGWILRRIADATSRDRMFEMIVERRRELRGKK